MFLVVPGHIKEHLWSFFGNWGSIWNTVGVIWQPMGAIVEPWVPLWAILGTTFAGSTNLSVSCERQGVHMDVLSFQW